MEAQDTQETLPLGKAGTSMGPQQSPHPNAAALLASPVEIGIHRAVTA